jgi:hypothetical protein
MKLLKTLIKGLVDMVMSMTLVTVVILGMIEDLGDL